MTLARSVLGDPRIVRLITLISAALHPPAGAGRIALALGFGALCHVLFAAGVLAMIVSMFFGLSESLGTVPWPWALQTLGGQWARSAPPQGCNDPEADLEMLWPMRAKYVTWPLRTTRHSSAQGDDSIDHPSAGDTARR